MNEVTEALEMAMSRIAEMKEILQNGEEDAAMTFLEFGQDAQYQIGRAVAVAMRSFLEAMQDRPAIGGS